MIAIRDGTQSSRILGLMVEYEITPAPEVPVDMRDDETDRHEYTREYCKQAIDASRRLAGMKQHPFSKAFWEGTERLWVEG